MARTEHRQELSQEARIKELSEENELLFEQLHGVQEELEKYYHKLKESERQKASAEAERGTPVTPRVLEALAENCKLRALVEQQKIALRIEAHNSLSTRLGTILIRGAGAPSSLFLLPFRLLKTWRTLGRTIPPAALGGTTFQKVIDSYSTKGREAVEKLLNSVAISPAMRANAYKALARHIKATNLRQAAEYTRLAWETDPHPNRLKLLAFRLYDAGEPITAEAMLDMLPATIAMNDWEKRKAARIRQESKQERLEQAGKESGGTAGENAEKRRQEEAEHKREVERLRHELAALQKASEQQKQESDALAVQTAHMLENLLTQFASDNAVLPQVMRIIMGASASR